MEFRTSASLDALNYPLSQRAFLEPHLPSRDLVPTGAGLHPFVTVTFATSLDSQLAILPGVPTALSGVQSKAMTHYLRSRHDAILVGVGTAVADDPGLNCRLDSVAGYGGDEEVTGQPRPVVIDPIARWDFNEESKIFKLARSARGKAPFVITAVEPSAEKVEMLRSYGGKFIVLNPMTTATTTSPSSSSESDQMRLNWSDILLALGAEGLRSVMIEGGAGVINTLLTHKHSHFVSSVIITIAPVWLGEGGVVVSPKRELDGDGVPRSGPRLRSVTWTPLGKDVVLCGKLAS